MKTFNLNTEDLVTIGKVLYSKNTKHFIRLMIDNAVIYCEDMRQPLTMENVINALVLSAPSNIEPYILATAVIQATCTILQEHIDDVKGN